MTRFIDITGQKFGRLTAISRTTNSKEGKSRFLCSCECGSEAIVDSLSLRRGFTTSCGCYRREFRKTGHHPAVNSIYSVYKRDSQKKGREFSLTKEELSEIIMGSCVYCGAPPSRKHRPDRIETDLLFNGVDRKDNTKGYTKDNVQSCCTTCNQAKHTLAEADFLSWIKKVFNFRKANNDS